MKVSLKHGDCLKVMQSIESGSINAVIADIPYGLVSCSWDSIIPLELMWLQLERIIKPNGTIVLFGSQPFTTKLISSNLSLWRYNWVWDKGRGVGHLLSKIRPLMSTEDICVFYRDLSNRKNVVGSYPLLRSYFRDLQDWIGLTKKAILDKVGGCADHCFRWGSSQWDLPIEATYSKLATVFGIDRWVGYREYKSLQSEYDSVEYLPVVYNPQMRSREKSRKSVTGDFKDTCYGDLSAYDGDILNEKYPINIIQFSKSAYKDMGLHPTQKPVALLEYLIKTHTNKGNVVLDFTMGSGTTGVAAVNLRRSFIGIELDEKYFDIAKKRVADAYGLYKQGKVSNDNKGQDSK